MKNVILAFDSFKGSLTSAEACNAAAKGVLQVWPTANVVEIPVSDGGEGLTDVLTRHSQSENIRLSVHDPLLQMVEASYGIVDNGRTAVIEMAQACGLTLVPLQKRNPERTSTFGFGEMILNAVERGCRDFILGIGGSATNDAGLGMLQALGATIYTAEGKIPNDVEHAITGADLIYVTQIDSSTIDRRILDCRFEVACDVQNPLYGPQGAAYVFAPQKGADSAMVKRLDKGLQNIIIVSNRRNESNGSGAAGGLGFALKEYLNASLRSGIELVLDHLHYDDKIRKSAIVFTGEGHSDKQTLMGKVPYGILRRNQANGCQTYLLSGGIDDVELLRQAGFVGCFSINEGLDLPLDELMKKSVAANNLAKKVEIVLKNQEIINL